jgi:hypothetical protein
LNRKILLVTLALAATPTAASAQSPEARIDAARARLTAAGIPAALLDGRVAQGRAKGVAMERIAASVERRAASLTVARQAMAPRRDLTAADLDAGADAVEAGIPTADLHALTELVHGADRAVAIAVLAQLHRDGLPAAQALERVTAALGKGPDALRTLPAQAAAERRRGGNASPR